MLKTIRFSVDLFNRFPDKARNEEERKRSEVAVKYLIGSLAGIDTLYLRTHPNTPSIYTAGMVQYAPDEPVTLDTGEVVIEDFKAIPELLRQGKGDCEDLASARVAELRVDGIKASPSVDWTNDNGVYTYHVLTHRDSISRNLPPLAIKVKPGQKTARGEAILYVEPVSGKPVIWESKDSGYIEDPSRYLGM